MNEGLDKVHRKITEYGREVIAEAKAYNEVPCMRVKSEVLEEVKLEVRGELITKEEEIKQEMTGALQGLRNEMMGEVLKEINDLKRFVGASVSQECAAKQVSGDDGENGVNSKRDSDGGLGESSGDESVSGLPVTGHGRHNHESSLAMPTLPSPSPSDAERGRASPTVRGRVNDIRAGHRNLMVPCPGRLTRYSSSCLPGHMAGLAQRRRCIWWGRLKLQNRPHTV